VDLKKGDGSKNGWEGLRGLKCERDGKEIWEKGGNKINI
jgi:hypothetical protein